MTLDQVALEVGVSASTLSRWERRGTSDEGERATSSRLPENLDVKTFELLSKWLYPAGENPDYYNDKGRGTTNHEDSRPVPDLVEAHLRADRNLTPAAAEMIASMVRAAYESHVAHSGDEKPDSPKRAAGE